jgi:hypothetical protein
VRIFTTQASLKRFDGAQITVGLAADFLESNNVGLSLQTGDEIRDEFYLGIEMLFGDGGGRLLGLIKLPGGNKFSTFQVITLN